MWYFIVFLISLSVIIDGNVNNQIMEKMQSCCDYGTEFAYNGISEDCSSAKVPYDISIICNHVSEQCCQEYNIKKAICEKGIQLAKTSYLRMSLKESLEQNCFDQCKLGATMGKSYAITSCNVTPLKKSPELLLFSTAFSQCCKAAATDGHDKLKSKPNTSAEKDIHTIVSSMPSLCEEFAPHELCAQRCIPIPGSYKCECDPGFELMSDGHSCQEVENNRCDSHNTCQQLCVKNGMENICSCRKGYQLMSDKTSCEDINECVLGIHDCDGAQYQCVNKPGSYRCEKHVNFLTTPLSKVEAEVFHSTTSEIINPTPTVVVPPQTASIYFTSDIMTNRSQLLTLLEQPDVDECAQGTHLCDQYQNCFNTNGSYECRCKQGFELDSTTGACVDIDECATGEALCGPLQVCTNLPGGYTCSCPAGHKLVGDHVCEDVDECALGGKPIICSQNADCINTVGSYQCRCHEGFKTAPINDKVCVDVDECTDSRPGALCQHRCNNVWGSYRCSCHRGYRLNPADNRTCTDVDECTEFKDKNLCIGRCLNEPGSYRCSCPSGYRLSEDKRSCIDINECETGEAPCASGDQYEGSSVVCVNTRGGYRCLRITCPPGYKLGRHRCSKIETYCSPADSACSRQPSTYSYNYVTFVSNLNISESKVDLFTMKGPSWPYAKMTFELRILDVDAPPSVKDKADINAFLLIQTGNQAVMTLVKPLEGPQSIELELSMELYSREQFGGIAVAKLFIYVSEYEF